MRLAAPGRPTWNLLQFGLSSINFGLQHRGTAWREAERSAPVVASAKVIYRRGNFASSTRYENRLAMTSHNVPSLNGAPFEGDVIETEGAVFVVLPDVG